MTRPSIPYGRQWVDDDDIAAVVDVLRSDMLTTGPVVARFEKALAISGGVAHATAVSSGTAALHAAYFAAGVGPGDEVIVPAMTFSATANAARLLGATIRLSDIDPETLTMSPSSVEKLVCEKTKVITPVDYAGHPAHYDELQSIASGCGATLVADACHSIGGSYKGRPVGSLADMSCFSFHPVKSVTTGEGGAVLSSSEYFSDRARKFRSHGIERGVLGDETNPGPWAYDIQELGLNYRLSDFQSALGLSQLSRLAPWIERRQQIASMYRERLSDIQDLELPPDASWCSHGYHLFVIRVPAQSRRAVFDSLQAAGIGVQVHYVPVNMLATYRGLGFRPEDTPVALETYQRSISISCFPKMQDDEVNRVAAAIRKSMP